MPKEKLTCDCNTVHQEQVDKVLESFNNFANYTQVYSFFHTLGDGTRFKILVALKTQELCVCDLAQVMNMTKSAISHQLKVLKKVGLIKNRKVGKNVYYSLDDEHVKNIIDIAIEHTEHLNLGGNYGL